MNGFLIATIVFAVLFGIWTIWMVYTICSLWYYIGHVYESVSHSVSLIEARGYRYPLFVLGIVCLTAVLVSSDVVVWNNRKETSSNRDLDDLFFGLSFLANLLIPLLVFPSHLKGQKTCFQKYRRFSYIFHLGGGAGLLLLNPLFNSIAYSILLFDREATKGWNWVVWGCFIIAVLLGILSLICKALPCAKELTGEKLQDSNPLLGDDPEYEFVRQKNNGDKLEAYERAFPGCRRAGYLLEFGMIVWIVIVNVAVSNKRVGNWD